MVSRVKLRAQKLKLRREFEKGKISSSKFLRLSRAVQRDIEKSKASSVLKAAKEGVITDPAEIQAARETLAPTLREERITAEREAAQPQPELQKGATVQVLEQTQEGELRRFKGKVVDEEGKILAVRTVPKEEQVQREKERARAEARRQLRPVEKKPLPPSPPKEVVVEKPKIKKRTKSQERKDRKKAKRIIIEKIVELKKERDLKFKLGDLGDTGSFFRPKGVKFRGVPSKQDTISILPTQFLFGGKSGGLNLIFHEIGHFVDRRGKLVKFDKFGEIEGSADLKKGERVEFIADKFAEFVDKPIKFQKKNPNLTKFFMAKLGIMESDFITGPKEKPVEKEEKLPKVIILKKATTKEELVTQFRLGQALPVPAAFQRATGGIVTIKKETVTAPTLVKRPLTKTEKVIEKLTTPVDVSDVPIVGGLQATFQTFRAVQRIRGERRLERGRKKLAEGKGFKFPVVETRLANLDTIIGQSDIFVSENIGQFEEDIRRPSTIITVGLFKGAEKFLGAIPGAGRFLKGGLGIGAGTLFITSEATQITKGEKTFAQSIGTLEAFLLTEKFFSAGAKAVSNRLKTLGKVEIPARKVFDFSVLTQKETFPTTKTLPEALREFRKVTGEEGFEVVSATATEFARVTKIRPGPKGAAGLEDPGLFVTPKGRASPAFLRIPGAEVPEAITEFKLFPETPKPQLIELTNIEAIRRLPRGVREAPGFEPVRQFFETIAEPGTAFITKRSEIGLGTAPRRPFEAVKEFKTPIPRTVFREGVAVKVEAGGKIKLGDILTPGGTGELEAVIPPQEIFEPLPSKRFTRFLNEVIPIREFKTTGEIVRGGEIPESFEALTKEISSGESSLASLIRGSRVISPISIFPAVPIISPVPSRVSRVPSLTQLLSQLGSEFSQVSRPSDVSVSRSLSELSASLSASEISKSVSGTSQSLSQSSSELSKSISKSISELSPSISISVSELSITPSLIPQPEVPPKRRKEKKAAEDYNAYGLKGATTKTPMWVKLNKTPVSRQNAIEIRNRAVDNTVSRFGKIAKEGSKFDNKKFMKRDKKIVPKKEPGIIDTFLSGTFRDFRIVGGKRVALPKGHVIENVQAAINTPGERKGLSLAKFKAQQRKGQKLNPLLDMFGPPQPITKGNNNNINNIDKLLKDLL